MNEKERNKVLSEVLELAGEKTETSPPNESVESLSDDIILFPIVTQNGAPLKAWQNTETALKYYGIKCRYNELTKTIEWNKRELERLSENAMIAELQSLFLQKGYSAGTDNALRSHIARISQEHSYHPIREYLMDLKDQWDGRDYIKELFDCFELIDAQKPFYSFLKSLFTKWLVTAVKLIFNDGTVSAQGILILVGGQGIGKTRWHKAILPNPLWGKEGLDITNDKDTIIQALSYWIVELGEYCTSKSHLEKYKRFVTNSNDIFRRPYAKENEKVPRSTIFYATTNEDEFLIDATGERRNWVIGLEGIRQIQVDVNCLWAQVAHLALNEKIAHWLNDDEIRKLNDMNEFFKERGEYEELLLSQFDLDTPKDKWVYLTPSDICEILSLDRRNAPKAIGIALNALAFTGITRMKRKGKERLRLYFTPLFVEDGNGNYRNMTAKKKSYEYINRFDEISRPKRPLQDHENEK